MKRIVFSIAMLAVLVTAGAAVGHLKAGDVTPVSATLTATTPTNVKTRTVTCGGETYEITTGRWSGTAASSTTDLAGPIELRLKSVYNATKKLGWIDGSLKISAVDDRSHAKVFGVNTDGKLDAWVRGKAGKGDGILFGSLSGSFSKTAGLTDGAIGSGTGTNAAVIAKRTSCKVAESTTRPSVRLLVKGEIGAVSSSSISVKPKDGSATQTCAVTDEDDVEKLEQGDTVVVTCAQVSGAWQLVKVKKTRR